MTRYTHSRAVRAVNWKGPYVASAVYRLDDMSYEDGYIGLSIGDNHSDPIVPTNIGDKQYSMQGVVWDVPDPSVLAVVHSGNRYTFTKGGFLEAIYIYVPDVSVDVTLRAVMVDISDPANPQSQTISLSGLVANEWKLISTGSRIMLPGSDIIIYVSSDKSNTTTNVTGGWTSGDDSDLAPVSQEWNANTADTILRIDKTDLDGTDRTTELMGILTGATIKFYETDTVNNNITYIVNAAPVDGGTFIQYDVTLDKLGIGGAPRKNRVTTMDAFTPVLQATEYSQVSDHWIANQPTFAVAGGYLRHDGVEPVGFDPNDAYGVDIQFQEATKSANWDIIPTSKDVNTPSTPGGQIGSIPNTGYTGTYTVGYGVNAKHITVENGLTKSVT